MLRGPSDSVTVTLIDTYATACEDDGPGTGSPVVARGTGEVTSDELTVTLTLNCANGFEFGDAEVTFTEMPDGTLDDSFGTTWLRPGT